MSRSSTNPTVTRLRRLWVLSQDLNEAEALNSPIAQAMADRIRAELDAVRREIAAETTPDQKQCG